jgi:branched-subunit amino acid ABC-type transport system permease component
MPGFEDLIYATTLLFFIFDPFATVPMFITLTRGQNEKEQMMSANKAVLVAGILFVIFALIGTQLLALFSITVDAFRIAGGIVLLLMALMSRSFWGKILVAIREDEDLAPHFGINTTRYKRVTFAATSAITGVAGAIFFSYQTYISSNYFTIGASFTPLAAAVIGGGGTALGPVYGGLIVLGAPEVFRSMNMWRPSFVGAVLVVVILLSPGGIVGLYQKIVGYFRRGGAN